MAEKRRALTRWELVDKIRTCADAIDNNADDIIGNYEKFDQVTISFTVKKYDDEQVKIYVDKSYIPEKHSERKDKKYEQKNGYKNIPNGRRK